MEQSVQTAQVDECTEVGDVLDLTLSDLTDQELFHERLALRLALGLENHATRNNDVPATLVELDDLELVDLANEVLDVRNPAQSDLRTREEGVDAHEVDGDTTLDLANERSLDWTIRIVCFADLLPDAEEVGLLLGEHDNTVVVFKALEENFDIVACLGRILEFVQCDRAFALKAELENDGGFRDTENLRVDDFAFAELLEVRAELQEECFELFFRGRKRLFSVRIVEEFR